MLYFTRLKIIAILGTCLLGFLLCLPNIITAPASWMPWRTVHLGLDLQGGSYLLLEVDMKTVVRDRLESLMDGVRQELRPQQAQGSTPARPGIFFQSLEAQPDQNRVSLRLRDATQTDTAVAALRKLIQPVGTNNLPDMAVASTPDGTITLTLSPPAMAARAKGAIEQSIEIVRRRIDETGVVEPHIAQQGGDRIIVQLPGINDPNRIKQLLGKTAKMTFRLVDETANPTANTSAPPGIEFLPYQERPGERIAVRKRVDVDGAELTDARAGTNPQTGEWVVNFTFNSVGTKRFADISRANVNRRFAIVLDDKVISAPVIREPITGGRGQISGSFTAASANDLAVLLRAGALPAPLTVVEERSVGPELGADSIRAGAFSLAVGFVLVVLFMGVFYGLFGWFANLALLVNVVLMLAIMSLLEATLTLPGMAGILLTLGVAVDANILVNERIREEARLGRPPLSALEHGFSRAFNTIFDSNAASFLSHVMLFAFGSGPVRGFAVTITIGIATTLFTNWMLTRLLVGTWYLRTRPRVLPV